MKKIYSFIVCIICSISLNAQQNHVTDFVNMQLPSGTRKLPSGELKTMARTKHPAIDQKEVDTAGEFYMINTFVLGINGAKVKTAKNYLEDTKKGYDNLFKMNGHPCTNCTSELKRINNYNVLILHQESQDWAYYAFFTIDDKSSAAVNGMLDYGKSVASNKSKALKTLYEILNNMTFK